MQIINGEFVRSEMNKNAMGGTELIATKMTEVIDKELLKEFQIIVSRVEEPLDETKIRILHLQDLPGDPASDHLKNGGWNKFHRLVFATNWQMQAFIGHYGIPYSKCEVIPNAMVPVPYHEKPKDVIRLGYWSTPHRGLNILVPVFDKLCETFDNIELDVYSSFDIYGWGQRDAQYQELFEQCKAHPKINYHGSVPNADLKKALEQIHILAYPSIWTETSCITLMEAMSAGITCVHPNLGALYETAAGWTQMYQWNEDLNQHAQRFYNVMTNVLQVYNEDWHQQHLRSQALYATVFYGWDDRVSQWEGFLRSLLNEPRTLPAESSGDFFEYRG